jgi:hypothetical protein
MVRGGRRERGGDLTVGPTNFFFKRGRMRWRSSRRLFCPVSIEGGVECPVFKFGGVIWSTSIVQGVIRIFFIGF